MFSFNAPIGDWNTARVTNMKSMFRDATAFNQDISGWNVSNVTNMANMFYFSIGSPKFNQDLRRWRPSPVAYCGFLGQNCAYYSMFVSDWYPDQLDPISLLFGLTILYILHGTIHQATRLPIHLATIGLKQIWAYIGPDFEEFVKKLAEKAGERRWQIMGFY